MTASIHETNDLPTPPGRDEGQGGGAQVTDLETVRAIRHVAAQQRRQAARSRDLTALLRDRPDLVGVHPPADLAVDAVRWSV